VKLLVINGPNLNMLGKREPETYGYESLAQITAHLDEYAKSIDVDLKHLQSNAEHVIIDTIHSAFKKIDFIIINPGAFTHTSIAIRDALLSVSIPFIEVHLSNVHARESFRQHSYLSDIAHGVICGLGAQGYEFAIAAAKKYLSK
jgi:3-dehydroquinate dehydratase-2